MLKNFTKTILLGVIISLFIFWGGLKNHSNIIVVQAQEDSGSSDSSDSGSYSSGDSGSYDNSSDYNPFNGPSDGNSSSYDNSSSPSDNSGGSYDNYSGYDNSSYDSSNNNSDNSYYDNYSNSSSGNTDNNSNGVIVLPGDSYDNSSYSNYDNSYSNSSSGDNSSTYDNSSDSTSGTNDASSWDYYDDSSYSSNGNSYDTSGYDSSSDSNSASSLNDYGTVSKSDIDPAERQNDQTIASKLGLKSFTAQETTGSGGERVIKTTESITNGTIFSKTTDRISEREYDAADIPSLNDGQVLVAGATTNNTDQPGQTQGGNTDTYYIADKNNLPDNYVLSPASSLASSDGDYQPVFIVRDKATALSEDAKADKNGDFSYASSVDPKLNNLGIDKIGQDSKLAEEFITVNTTRTSELRTYNEHSGELLSGFRDYGASLPSDTSQADKEKAAYDYVNGKIVVGNDSSSSYDSGHSLAEAVSCGQGVCRDKAPALVTTLNAAGIPAAQVDVPGHTFVAVLNKDKNDGSVDHYLDPTFYETYLPLQRPSVKPYQLFPVK